MADCILLTGQQGKKCSFLPEHWRKWLEYSFGNWNDIKGLLFMQFLGILYSSPAGGASFISIKILYLYDPINKILMSVSSLECIALHAWRCAGAAAWRRHWHVMGGNSPLYFSFLQVCRRRRREASVLIAFILLPSPLHNSISTVTGIHPTNDCLNAVLCCWLHPLSAAYWRGYRGAKHQPKRQEESGGRLTGHCQKPSGP